MFICQIFWRSRVGRAWFAINRDKAASPDDVAPTVLPSLFSHTSYPLIERKPVLVPFLRKEIKIDLRIINRFH